jgi:hypothetical protein
VLDLLGFAGVLVTRLSPWCSSSVSDPVASSSGGVEPSRSERGLHVPRLLLARMGHAPFSGRLDGAFREEMFSGCNRGGPGAMRFGFHLMVREDPLFASFAFCYCFLYILASFHS